MKKLLVYMKDYKKECILGPLFKLLEAGFDLTVPVVTAAIIDQGIAQQDRNCVLRYGMVLILLAIVGLTCSITAQYFAAKAAVGFSAKLRHALFAHIESLSFAELDDIGTSRLITRMTSDINQVQSGVNMALRLFLRSPFIVLGAMVLAFFQDVRAALVFVVAIPLLSVVIFGIMVISMPLYKKVQGALDQVLGSTRDNLTGVRVIRAFHRENEEEEAFEQKNDFLARSQLFVGRIAALTNPVTYVIINIALVVLLWTSGIRVNIGTLSQGQVVALINYLSQILVELVKLANTIVLSNKALACAARVEAIMEIESSLDVVPAMQEESGRMADSGSQKGKAAPIVSAIQEKGGNIVKEQGARIVFSHVSMTYQGSAEPSVADVDFTAEPGQTVGIIGGTGSGKSSLVHLIPRFYDVTEGTVAINGTDVRNMPLETLRGMVGIVLQKAVLFRGSIRENLLWGNEHASEEELVEALQLSQAMEFVEKKEGGMDSHVEQGGRNLSGGQRQRLTIARALVRKPSILVLDDSTSALDYATDARLRAGLKSLEYKPVIFMVSQRTSSIRHADLILVMEDGRVIGKGTHEELLESCEVYREIHQSQFQKKENVG